MVPSSQPAGTSSSSVNQVADQLEQLQVSGGQSRSNNVQSGVQGAVRHPPQAVINQLNKLRASIARANRAAPEPRFFHFQRNEQQYHHVQHQQRLSGRNQRLLRSLSDTPQCTRRQTLAGLKCGFCNELFYEVKALEGHLSFVHDGRGGHGFGCNVDGCAFTFRTSRQLIKHQILRHRRCPCGFCL